ncbi:MAG: response regulator transcription factor [Eubacteriales bacterium]|jgi:DNA-binding response OmpR family regulator
MFRILVADDETEIRNLLELYLSNEGYEVLQAATGTEALEVVRREHIDLCLLDIMMPGMDGFHVLQEIRKFSNMPVIILSAKGQDTDKILGLNLGADDYIVKPFNPLEAVARVNSNIRRFTSLGGTASANEAPKLVYRDLTLDQSSCVLIQGERRIELSAAEYRIMTMFMENPGRVFTKKQIAETGWGYEDGVSDNSVMVCISKLREKISPQNPNAYIRTIRGLGYRLEA